MNESGSRMEALQNEGPVTSRHLMALARDASAGSRADLANAVGDMLTTDLNAHEQALASDILINLLRQAELDLRQALAERISVLAHAPQELVLALAHDDISVARPVLLHSLALTDLDLIYLIKTQSEAHAQTIACRAQLGPGVCDQLVATGDTLTILNLLQNRGAQLGKTALRSLTMMAVRTAEIHEPLLARPEITADLALRLYWCVSFALQQELKHRFPFKAGEIEMALSQIVQELSDAGQGRRRVTPEIAGLARAFRERGEISIEALKSALRRRQMAFFLALFAEYLGVEPALCDRFIHKEGGKAMAIACRARDIPKADFATIFLLSRGARAGDKVVDQRELAGALKAFDGVTAVTAQELLTRWVRNVSTVSEIN